MPASQATAVLDYASLAAQSASADPFVLASPQSLINVPSSAVPSAVPTPSSVLPDPLQQAAIPTAGIDPAVDSLGVPVATPTDVATAEVSASVNPEEAVPAAPVDPNAVIAAAPLDPAAPVSAAPSLPSGVMRRIRRSITMARENRNKVRQVAADDEGLSDADSCDFHSCDDGSSVAESEAPKRRKRFSMQLRKLFKY